MTGVTVTVRLSAESADLMRKCVGNEGQAEIDAFFETAIGALAEKFIALDAALPTSDFSDGTAGALAASGLGRRRF